MQLRNFFAFASLALAAAAQAQYINLDVPLPQNYYAATTGLGTLTSSLSQTVGQMPAPLGEPGLQVGITGSFTYTNPRKDETDILAWARGAQYFTVGQEPIQIDYANLTYDLRMVNSGGSLTNPDVTQNLHADAFLYEYVPTEQSYYFTGISAISTTAVLAGNGYSDITGSYDALPKPFVLTPGTSYMALVELVSTVSFTNTSQLPTEGVTLEFGKFAGSGVTMNLGYKPVPEPATLAALAIGMAAFLRRNKSQS